MRLVDSVKLAACAFALNAAVIGDVCAQAPTNHVVRIRVINDQNGPYSGTGGPGSAIAAKMAIQDFGGKVLGQPIDFAAADHQNKPDLASSLVRQWIDKDGVDAVVDGASSAASLAIQDITRARGKIFLISGAASSALTGEACSPTGTQWAYDTYSLARSTATTLVKRGAKRWYFLTADYAFGHALETDTSQFVKEAGGQVLGSRGHPLGANDFSSQLMTASAAKPDVIGLLNGGTDFSQSLAQASEFGLTSQGIRMASLSGMISDIDGVGLDKAQGLFLTESFYWDLNKDTRAFSERFMKLSGGRPPTMVQAGVYAAVNHYLKAVAAAGTDDGPTVAKKMREIPVNDFYNHNVKIREDGRVMVDMYLFQVKTPAESKGRWDDYKVIEKVSGESVFRPLAAGHCPYVKP